MKKSYIRLITRELKGSFARFAAIFAIIALGTGFLSGLLATTPDMKNSADNYYDENNMMDIRLVSTGGLTSDDVNAIASIDEVGAVMPGYTSDEIISTPTAPNEVARIHSLPSNIDNNPNYLNKVILTEGRMPQSSDECVVLNEHNFDNSVNLGDKITISSANDDASNTFCNTEFTVVGFVDSPYYLSSIRESSNVGSGYIDTVIYVNESAFNLDYYTDVFLTLPEATSENCFSDTYFSTLEDVKADINNIAPERCNIRYNELISQANSKLQEAQIEYEKGKETAISELKNAKAQLDLAQDEYNTLNNTITQGEDTLSSINTTIKEKETSISSGYEELEAAQNTLNTSMNEYYNALNEFNVKSDTVNSQINAKQVSLDLEFQKINAAQAQLDSGYTYLNSLGNEINETQNEIDYLYSQGRIEEAQALEVVLGKLQAEYTTLESYLASKQAELDSAASIANELQNQLNTYKSQVQNELSVAKDKLDTTYATLAYGQAQLDQTLSQLNSANSTLEAAKAEISNKEAELEGYKKTLATAGNSLAAGFSEYETHSEEVYSKLSDAQTKIDKAKSDINNKITVPQWYVLDRNQNTGYASFNDNADKVQSIATIFPVFFFLVAALVALTTMSRMVEEERIQIGTLKALGYSKFAISLNYTSYAAMSSILGSIAGLAIGFKLFPTLIWNAYSALYTLPEIKAEFLIGYALIIGLGAVICTILTAVISSYNSLKEVPAELMHAKAPKPGKRILLEKIPLIWSKMSFIHKVTARNLFRYKKRFLMTVIGVAGCTALLVTGFGLRDSFSDVINDQYSNIYKYDTTISCEPDDFADDNELTNVLNDSDSFNGYMPIYYNNSTVNSKNESLEASLSVPKDISNLSEFITFTDCKNNKSLQLNDDGVIITQKMSEVLDIDTGDTFTLTTSEGQTVDLFVSGVMKNYVMNNVYMTPTMYQNTFNKQADFNGVLANSTVSNDEFYDQISEELLSLDSVSAVTFNRDIENIYADIINSLNYIVIVLIITAAALAFVVLYNLININITEREKEIGTIKVLGFYNKEVNSYIFRETIILTIIGTIVGLILGVALHKFVILSVEMDDFMFGRNIFFLSYVYSAALTLIFSWIVSLIMSKKLKKVSMVEAMKSNE